MAQFGEMNDEQLVHRTLQVERDLVNARFRHAMNQLENTSHLRVLRREIARLRTETTLRERTGGKDTNALRVTHGATFVAGGPGAGPSQKGGFLSGIVDKLAPSE